MHAANRIEPIVSLPVKLLCPKQLRSTDQTVTETQNEQENAQANSNLHRPAGEHRAAAAECLRDALWNAFNQQG